MVVIVECRYTKIVLALCVADLVEKGDGERSIRSPTHMQYMICAMGVLTLHWNDGRCCSKVGARLARNGMIDPIDGKPIPSEDI